MGKFDTIYLEGQIFNKDEVSVSPESLMALFILQCCQDLDVKIVFTTQFNFHKLREHFQVNNKELCYNFEYLDNSECPEMIQKCLLPAVQVENEPSVVVGLSASLRHFLNLKADEFPNHFSNRLLGFRRSCLQACSEVSIWTKFCEIEVVEMIKDVYFKFDINLKQISIPSHLIRYERHLERPPILHNILKRKQDNFRELVKDKNELLRLKKKTLKELPDLEHKYAEGVDFTLADVLLYVCFSLCIHRLKKVVDFEEISPLVVKWLRRLEENEVVLVACSLLSKIMNDFSPVLPINDIKIVYPNVPNDSLYKNDPSRYKSRWRSFTQQKDIDVVNAKLKNSIITQMSLLTTKSIKENKTNTFVDPNSLWDGRYMRELSINEDKGKRKILVHSLQFEHPLKWDSFPQAVIPLDGDLPLSRLERKCQQLESMAQVIISIAKDGNKIVDFCSGGGHLGILVAYCLPKCTIILVENKKNSLNKAITRVQDLNLKNVQFYQCNLDYFCGHFDIGVCLHACGAATDLMMQKCFLQKASFVCCPCCYGSLKPNHILSYPRSSLYKDELKISVGDYEILGHAADQTHDEQNPKTIQGKSCMQYVDYDRLSAAESLGYDTILSIMNPPECTPKNHILIGII